MRKDSRYYRMIRSARWTELRRRKLNDSPLCELCLQSGLYVSATEVHHVTPCETARTDSEMERLMFGYANLQSLCHGCHASEHRRCRSHSAAAERVRQDARTGRFIDRFFPSDNPEERGESFFSGTPSAPNPPASSREIFLVRRNSLGGKTPDGQR